MCSGTGAPARYPTVKTDNASLVYIHDMSVVEFTIRCVERIPAAVTISSSLSGQLLHTYIVEDYCRDFSARELALRAADDALDTPIIIDDWRTPNTRTQARRGWFIPPTGVVSLAPSTAREPISYHMGHIPMPHGDSYGTITGTTLHIIGGHLGQLQQVSMNAVSRQLSAYTDTYLPAAVAPERSRP